MTFPARKKQSDIIQIPKKHNWSNFQKDIFREIAKGSGNLIVIARAGVGKTHSLVEASKYIPKGKKSLFCAFSKHIQEELRNRLGSYIDCYTLHALGYKVIKQRFGQHVQIDNYKCNNIVEEILGEKNYDLIDSIVKTVGFCKANLVDTPTKIEEIIVQYDIDIIDCELEEFIKYVVKTLRLCKEKTDIIDFNDMIWYPFIFRLKGGSYDYCMIDECQDLSRAQIEFALSSINKNGRIIAVLDNYQVIFSFAGANLDVLDQLRTRLSPKELPLPICYRCPKKVVALAQTLVKDIQPYDQAVEGEIICIHNNDLIKYAKPGSYVISRFNAPLIKTCMMFLKNQIPSNMLGRDIGNGLQALIKKSKKKTVKDLLIWLGKWEKTEREHLIAKYPKANGEYITDKAECIRMLCEDAESIAEVKKNIDNLFQDNDEKKIILHCSIHRVKGKQANDCFILADTLTPALEGENLCLNYVAFTRVQKRLYLVSKNPDDLKDRFNIPD